MLDDVLLDMHLTDLPKGWSLSQADALTLSQLARFTNLTALRQQELVDKLSPSVKPVGRYIMDTSTPLNQEQLDLALQVLKWRSPEVRRAK